MNITPGQRLPPAVMTDLELQQFKFRLNLLMEIRDAFRFISYWKRLPVRQTFARMLESISFDLSIKLQ
jgi:hypothetical protein